MENVITPEALPDTALRVYDGGRHPLAAMFGRDETLLGRGYAVYCYFEIPEEKDMRLVKAVFDKNGSLHYQSIANEIPAAAWYEREIHDMFGLVPEGHPDLRPLVLHESFPAGFYPLRKSVQVNARVRGERQFKVRTARGQGLFEVPVGPIHAGIIEPGHFRFSQAGEAMLQLDAKLFFTHRGIELSLSLAPRLMAGLKPTPAGILPKSPTWLTMRSSSERSVRIISARLGTLTPEALSTA